MCHLSRIVSHEPFFGSLASLIACFVTHYLTHWLAMPRTSGLVLLYFVSRNQQCVKSVFVGLSTHLRRLQAFSACAVFDTNSPIFSAIWTLSFRRSLKELKKLVVARFSNQRTSFDSRLKWWVSSDFLKSLSNIFLCGWFSNLSSKCFFSLCFNLFNSGMWNAKVLKINTAVTARSFPVLIFLTITSWKFGTSVTRGNLGDPYILQ